MSRFPFPVGTAGPRNGSEVAMRGRTQVLPIPGVTDRIVADEYRLIRLIGTGGMGEVHLARALHDPTPLAVKLFRYPFGAASDDARQRFFREARVLCVLRHPNTVEFRDAGFDADGTPFIVTEFVEGMTIKTLLEQRGKLDETTVLDVALQICASLGNAHLNGVVHRDVKPANIMLQERDGPFVKVLDFGICKELEFEDRQLTSPGHFIGSARYSAPEQVLGGSVDARTDIYSLGVTMFEMLAGVAPFRHRSSETIQAAHLFRTPPMFAELDPTLEIQPRTEATIRRCLEKAPAHRWPSVRALIEELHRCAEGLRAAGPLRSFIAPRPLRDTIVDEPRSHPPTWIDDPPNTRVSYSPVSEVASPASAPQPSSAVPSLPPSLPPSEPLAIPPSEPRQCWRPPTPVPISQPALSRQRLRGNGALAVIAIVATLVAGVLAGFVILRIVLSYSP